MSTLFYGDNLDVLRQHVKDETADLVYLDPPFNSNQDYNVLFAEHGTRAAAQIKAFEDTWHWDESAARAYADVVEQGGKVSLVMQSFRTFLGENDMLAYLSMMAPRLVELRRVMKPTASIYLHCDPTASHYLKMLMDAVFGPENFRNEIIWKRTASHSAARRWNDVHDSLLFYSRTDAYQWMPMLLAHSDEYTARFKRTDEAGRRWSDDNLTAPGVRGGDSGAKWRGYDPTARGCHWKVNLKTVATLLDPDRTASLTTTGKLELLDQHGFILWPKKGPDEGGGFPRFKRYLSGGHPVQDVITDIPPINSQAQERLGYPTQKPQALLERILKSSSNEGDMVLDPFCGCGTTVAAAQALGRNWIGIDITHLAINLIKTRLRDSYGPDIDKTYSVIGEPTSVEGAEELARTDPYQFQWWALGLVGARPVEQKKGADKGIDGRLFFHDEGPTGKTKQAIISVKAGALHATYVRDLVGVVSRENAVIGVLIAFDAFTKPMRSEAASAGFYESPWGKHPKIQLVTVAELLGGKEVDIPRIRATFKQAPKAYPELENLELLAAEERAPYGRKPKKSP